MSWFKNLFSKRVSVYISTNQDDYFRVANKLQSEGISFRTKTPFNPNPPTGMGYSSRDTQITYYEIYVKPDDEYRAVKVIHEKE
ncbi:hypothetical protein [Alicyclobacillus fastidiosus]|uniref:DUF2007 domain-containing protein n=1 Tax=Alicyclobacillus fastidiosus TaxID=392011 RepID=A0ABV5ALC6_9BACL